MPQLVDSFMSPSSAESDGEGDAYGSMLHGIELNSSRYFAKYMMSTHPSAASGKLLAGYYAYVLSKGMEYYDELLAELVIHRATVDQSELEGVAGGFEFLAILMGFHDGEGDSIPSEVKNRILAYMELWTQRYPRHDIGRWSKNAAQALSGEPGMAAKMRERRDAMEGLQTCAKRGCIARLDLLMCARCRTVLYCSREHQVADWRDPTWPHKAFCYETIW